MVMSRGERRKVRDFKEAESHRLNSLVHPGFRKHRKRLKVPGPFKGINFMDMFTPYGERLKNRLSRWSMGGISIDQSNETRGI